MAKRTTRTIDEVKGLVITTVTSDNGASTSKTEKIAVALAPKPAAPAKPVAPVKEPVK